jgi:equilibrative nucleoside transporter 1/2/3
VGLFFAFVLLNGVTQAIAGSYLQTSVIAVASLFGPTAVQAMMSGQAAVAVAVSSVQVISAAAFLWGKTKESIEANLKDGSAEEKSAFTFFALSTVFLVASAVAHGWLVRMPIYKTIIAPLEQHKTIRETGSPHERQALTSVGRSEFSDEKNRITRVAKANITYEIAVAYVFVVTLVRTSFCWRL